MQPCIMRVNLQICIPWLYLFTVQLSAARKPVRSSLVLNMCVCAPAPVPFARAWSVCEPYTGALAVSAVTMSLRNVNLMSVCACPRFAVDVPLLAIFRVLGQVPRWILLPPGLHVADTNRVRGCRRVLPRGVPGSQGRLRRVRRTVVVHARVVRSVLCPPALVPSCPQCPYSPCPLVCDPVPS